MVNWMPTVAGFLAAFGVMLTQITDPPWVKTVGMILGAAGTALLGLVAKQYNVHGGTVPQATPPSVQEQTKLEGIALVATQAADKAKETLRP